MFPHLARARAGPCRSGTRGTSCLRELERRARRAQLVMRKSAKKGRESLGECFAFRLPPSSLSPSEEMESSKVSDGQDEKKKKKKRLRDCFPLALPLRFVSALLRAPLLPFFEAEHLVTRGTSSECAPPHHRRPVDRRSSPLKIGRIKIQTRSPAFSPKLENDLLLLLQDPRGERGHGRAQE